MKENDEITEKKLMYLIKYKINNICAESFLGWTHEGKKKLTILPDHCTLPAPRGKTMYNAVRPRVFVTGDLALYVIVHGREGRYPLWCFDCMLEPS